MFVLAGPQLKCPFSSLGLSRPAWVCPGRVDFGGWPDVWQRDAWDLGPSLCDSLLASESLFLPSCWWCPEPCLTAYLLLGSKTLVSSLTGHWWGLPSAESHTNRKVLSAFQSFQHQRSFSDPCFESLSCLLNIVFYASPRLYDYYLLWIWFMTESWLNMSYSGTIRAEPPNLANK